MEIYLRSLRGTTFPMGVNTRKENPYLKRENTHKKKGGHVTVRRV